MSSLLCRVVRRQSAASILRHIPRLSYSSSSLQSNDHQQTSTSAQFHDYSRLVTRFHQNLSKTLAERNDLAGHPRHVKDTLLSELDALKEELDQLEKLSTCQEMTTNLMSDDSRRETIQMQQLIQEELKTIETRLRNVKDNSLDLLAHDELSLVNDVIVELEHAVGGHESMLFTKEMTEFYTTFASMNGWTVVCVDAKMESECNGFRSAALRIQGSQVFNRLRHEAGVHRVQRVPKTEKNGRIHTSTICVQVVPLFPHEQLSLNRNTLKVETMRSQGAGGQNVNKTETCVRITHLPTGISVECQEQRSQSQNKTVALEKLTVELSRRRAAQLRRREADIRKSQVQTVERSDKIRTYNFPQDRITEHRLQEDLHNLKAYMRGECADTLNQWMQSLHEQRIGSLRHEMAVRLQIDGFK